MAGVYQGERNRQPLARVKYLIISPDSHSVSKISVVIPKQGEFFLPVLITGVDVVGFESS